MVADDTTNDRGSDYSTIGYFARKAVYWLLVIGTSAIPFAVSWIAVGEQMVSPLAAGFVGALTMVVFMFASVILYDPLDPTNPVPIYAR